jgi:L-alanine-DL-glutamate epimerase-like enolase superfamily enzyme
MVRRPSSGTRQYSKEAKINAIQIQRLETFVFRVPLEKPVVTSFGAMRDRPAVLVRVSDGDGACGWGEVWCNFPVCGAEHRARLLKTVIAPMLWEKKFKHPEQVFEFLTKKTHVLALQSGEAGPLAQVIAGIDIAIWDMVSRREGRALQTMLSDKTVIDVPAYASGIHPLGAVDTIAYCREIYGHEAFKVKVGFGAENDLAVVDAVRRSIRVGDRLMLDANQAWDVDCAMEVLADIEHLAPDWIEEPLAADASLSEWRAVGEATNIPISGGENVRGAEDFHEIINEGVFDVIQPDVCKWGGITGCLRVARWALEAGLRYCPHYLGGGIGLVASAHILAAAGGNGLLEIDVNPNPLREALAQPFPKISGGRFTMPVGSGLGVEPDLDAVKSWLTQRYDIIPK